MVLLTWTMLSVSTVMADDYLYSGNIRYKVQDSFNQELRVTFPEESDYTTTDLVIPATIKNKKGEVWTVTSIGEHAFSSSRGYKVLRSVTIPKTVKSIHIDAFEGSLITQITADCPVEMPIVPIREQLKVLNLGASATKATCMRIGERGKTNFNLDKVTLNPANKDLVMVDGVLYDRAKTVLLFFPRDKKGAYVMPATVKEIPYQCFRLCDGLTSVTIGQGVSNLSTALFEGCTSLQTLTILGPVAEIREKMCCECKALKQVSLPASVKSIGVRAFYKCSLESVTVPASVKIIKDYAFAENKTMKKLVLPAGLETIGENAFYMCSFASVSIPASVKTIKGYAFAHNDYLKAFLLPAGIQDMGGLTMISGCSSLESINISPSLPIKTLGNYCFSGCAALKEIVIPESVTSIGQNCFDGCKAKLHFYPTTPPAFNSSIKDGQRLVFFVKPGCRETYIKSQWAWHIEDIFDNLGTAESGKAATTIVAADVDKAYDVVDNMPSFPGGQSSLFQFLSQNIKYPLLCEEKGIQGRVICSFIVERDGSISNVLVSKSVHELLDREAVRIIKAMPKWIPGRLKDGTSVRVKYTMPVTFRLQ